MSSTELRQKSHLAKAFRSRVSLKTLEVNSIEKRTKKKKEYTGLQLTKLSKGHHQLSIVKQRKHISRHQFPNNCWSYEPSFSKMSKQARKS